MSFESPFGNSITSEDIVDTLSFFDDWEERYKYIIDLGKELPGMSDDKKTDEFLLRGCQIPRQLHCCGRRHCRDPHAFRC